MRSWFMHWFLLFIEHFHVTLSLKAPSCFNEGEIRLRSGTTSREGRVEICLGGVWGTVCDNGWSTTDARVVCRQLGLPTIGAFTSKNFVCLHRSHLLNFFLFRCQVIFICIFWTWKWPNCNVICWMQWAGDSSCQLHLFHTILLLSLWRCWCPVSRYADIGESNPLDFKSYNTCCTDPTTATANCTDGELRLRGGNTSREGRVEMCYERQWGTVCDRYWGEPDAKVACRQLGFSSFGNFLHKNLCIPAQPW